MVVDPVAGHHVCNLTNEHTITTVYRWRCNGAFAMCIQNSVNEQSGIVQPVQLGPRDGPENPNPSEMLKFFGGKQ